MAAISVDQPRVCRKLRKPTEFSARRASKQAVTPLDKNRVHCDVTLSRRDRIPCRRQIPPRTPRLRRLLPPRPTSPIRPPSLPQLRPPPRKRPRRKQPLQPRSPRTTWDSVSSTKCDVTIHAIFVQRCHGLFGRRGRIPCRRQILPRTPRLRRLLPPWALPRRRPELRLRT